MKHWNNRGLSACGQDAVGEGDQLVSITWIDCPICMEMAQQWPLPPTGFLTQTEAMTVLETARQVDATRARDFAEELDQDSLDELVCDINNGGKAVQAQFLIEHGFTRADIRQRCMTDGQLLSLYEAASGNSVTGDFFITDSLGQYLTVPGGELVRFSAELAHEYLGYSDDDS